MSVVSSVSVDLAQMNCGECGIVFAVPSDFRAKRVEDRASWYCPNGHGRHFTGESAAEKLQRQLDAERDRRAAVVAERDQALASLKATKGVVTRMRKRAIVGACQFCHRTFANVARHVATKHPTETPEIAP